MKYLVFILAFALPQVLMAQVLQVSKTTKLEKVPKSIFLIKKAKINAEVGEPQFYPAEAQLRTIIYDTALQSTKKYE
jgi:hypothetical protein